MKGEVIMNKEKANTECQLVQFLQDGKGNVLDVLYDVYEQFLKESKSPQSLLPIIFEYAEKIGSDEENSVKVPDGVREEIEAHFSEINDIATKNAKKNQSPDIFYANLWEDIFVSSPLSQSSEQCAVLLRILNENVRVLPYFQAVDLCRMEDSEFKASFEKIQIRIVESTHMLNRHFEQKTEIASQLCRIAKDLSQEDTYVYWATMISLIERSSYRAGYSRAVSEIKKKLDTDIEGE